MRRTRSFIQDNYADTDPDTGRKYLTYEDGNKSYFPTRIPKTIKFPIDESDPNDQYARLYSPGVVETINKLELPRYGLGLDKYVADFADSQPTQAEERQIQSLSRGGRRLMGFCRTNLFKRLESSGAAFLLSVERHLLRNYVFLHAIGNGLPLPIGTQDAEMLDSRFNDADTDELQPGFFDLDDDDDQDQPGEGSGSGEAAPRTKAELDNRAAAIYELYESRYRGRFRWLRSGLFLESLEKELQSDSEALLGLLQTHGSWRPGARRQAARSTQIVDQ